MKAQAKDPRRPVAHWLQETPSGRDLVFALYTRGCLYRVCSFCSLPALSAGDEAVGAEDIKAQADFVLAAHPRSELEKVEKVSVYNAGSVLDQRTLPTPALEYLIGRVRELPGLRTFSLESRAEFVEGWELDALRGRLGPVELEVALGYETQDERIRNRVLRKGLSEKAFSELCALLALHGVRLKAYVMVKPDVALSEGAAVAEAARTLTRIDELGDSLGLKVTAHLNPTYVSKGSALEREFQEQGYKPPRLWSVVDILERVRPLELPIQIGLDTEGLAVRGGTYRNCGRCDKAVREALKRFSATQDYGPLGELSCACRGKG